MEIKCIPKIFVILAVDKVFIMNSCIYIYIYINPSMGNCKEKLIKRAGTAFRRRVSSRIGATLEMRHRILHRALTKVPHNKERACSCNSSKSCLETDTVLSRVLMYPSPSHRIFPVTSLHARAFADAPSTSLFAVCRAKKHSVFIVTRIAFASRIKIATREIRRALFYGELYPGDIKYLITRSGS